MLLLSSLCATIVQAHEVTPAIANFEVVGQELVLDIRLNAEALLAGIDLDGLDDTNNAQKGAGDYDSLRALDPTALMALVERQFDRLIGGPVALTVDDSPLRLSLSNLSVQNVPSVELARATTVSVRGIVNNPNGAMTLYWPRGYGTLILRQNDVEKPFTGTLQGGDKSDPILLRGGVQIGGLQALIQYIPVGFDHILPKGLDHILFVLGLFFLSLRLGPLLWQISAFTLAHTVTLAAGALGWIAVPASIVEPLIAASITYVAIENILAKGLTPWRPFVVFGFGLLHGLGFASVLAEFGLPESQFIPALIGFNIGVELGQLTVIAIAFLALGLWFGRKPWYRKVIATPCSILIAGIGAYWVVERVFL